MKPVIVYYSLSGNNTVLAEALQRKLQCGIYRITELGKRTRTTILLDSLFNRTPAIRIPEISLRQYDKVIFIAPVWAGGIASPLRSFFKLQKAAIDSYAFISVCGGGAPGQLEKLTRQLTRLTGKKPLCVTELALSSLPDANQKNLIAYHFEPKDLAQFGPDIEKFISAVSLSHVPVTVHPANQQG